jgi:signal peptidase I
MMDTLLIGDYVIIDRRSSTMRPVQRGDVMVFGHPIELETLYLKRVVGLPGETVELREGFLYIDGRRLDEPYVMELYRSRDLNRDFGPVEVRPRSFFFLGDHRNASNDSRFWGSVSTDLLDGRARSIWWSYDETPRSPFGDRQDSWFTAPVRLLTNTRWNRLGRSIDRVEYVDAH